MNGAASIRTRVRLLLVLLAGMLVLPSCAGRPVKQTAGPEIQREGAIRTVAADASTLAPASLEGGDARAWLTSDGTAGDNGACNARIRLPLSTTPDWTYTYSAAEIGPDPSSDLVHYNGVIAGSGGRSAVFMLDAANGEELFRGDPLIHPSMPGIGGEIFDGFMFSPRGRLTALDGAGRFYVWAWPGRSDGAPMSLGLLSCSETQDRTRGGFVALEDSIVGSNGRIVCSMDQSNLTDVNWNDQLAAIPVGVVASFDGVVISWTEAGLISCCNPDGTLRWRSDEGSRVFRVQIPPDGDRAYVTLWTGELISRESTTGREQWRRNIAALMPEQEQQKVLAKVNELIDRGEDRGPGHQSRLIVYPQLVSQNEHGLMVVMRSGDAALLDPATGAVRWKMRLGAMADHALNFTNGVLVHLVFEVPGRRGGWLTVGAFQLTAPDWPEIEDKELMIEAGTSADFAGRSEGKRLRAIYGRFVVLDPLTGKVVDTFIESDPAGGAIIPALDKVVVAQENSLNLAFGSQSNSPCSIAAYNWLEAGGA